MRTPGYFFSYILSFSNTVPGSLLKDFKTDFNKSESKWFYTVPEIL